MESEAGVVINFYRIVLRVAAVSGFKHFIKRASLCEFDSFDLFSFFFLPVFQCKVGF